MSLNSSSDNTQPVVLTCKEINIETHDVKSYIFSYPNHEFKYFAGQYICFSINIAGEKHQCNYTLSSSPTDKTAISITIKRVNGGKVSNYFHDHFSVGDTISIQKIAGSFYLPEPLPQKILLISAGCGVTPMLSMLRYLAHQHTKSHIIFLHSAQSEADLIARREVEQLAHQLNHCEVVYTLTQSAKPRWLGFQGRVNESMLANISNIKDYQVFSCGPKSFRATVRQILIASKLPEQNYHEESFGEHEYSRETLLASHSSKPPLWQACSDDKNSPDSNSPNLKSQVSIYFKRWNKKHQGNQQQTLLEQGESAGLILPYSCRAGCCGRCKAKLITGEVKQGCTDGLSVDEQQRGYILLCCSSPLTDVELSHEE